MPFSLRRVAPLHGLRRGVAPLRGLPHRSVVLALLVVPGVASAGKVVLTPLLADESVNAKQRLGVHQLIASELEFQPEVEGVVDLNATPPSLDDMCLTNPRCMSGIAQANGGNQVVAGRMSGAGTNFVLDIVFYDGSQIARRKQYNVPQDPTALANAITPIVREILTGSTPGSEKPKPTAVNLDDDEDLAVAGGAAMADLLVDAPPPPAPLPAPRAAPRPAPPPPAPAAPMGSDADARRLAMAAAATGMMTSAPAPAPAPPPPAPSDADLAQMISFGGSVNDISAEEIDAMIKFGAPPGVSAPAPMQSAVPVAPAPIPAAMMADPMPAPRPVSSGRADPTLAEEEAELAALERGGGIADLDDDPKKSSRAATAGRSTSTVPKPAPAGGGGMGDIGHIVQITARGGYSKYYTFDFITGGGEIAVAPVGGFHLMAGVEVYAVNRILPPELQIQTGLYSEWNYIFPINVGAMYKFSLGIAQPYVGADAIFVQYYRDAVGADWAAGGRFRTGVDLMFIPNLGFNVNVAAGGWFGQNWALIEQGVGAAGFLPQVSGGPVVAF